MLLALSALMCERPVLVTCSVRSLLSVAVSSLKALLHPLGWHHAYAPLLPAAEVRTSGGGGGGFLLFICERKII